MNKPMIWVAYATPEQQWHLAVPFQAGMTALDAIQQSDIAEQVALPEPLSLGIFGVRLQDYHQPLVAGDRVEIYRPLTINPKDIRRKRAEKNPVGRYARGNLLRKLKPSSE
ncbi:MULTISPECIES: RnfH family protein [unclassified Acinetobacter]|uniref:RnfH family protein n=1 Tax=unclassified Acinetobacter TaxID=196816 RepID=UPI001C23EDC4|nr:MULTISPECIES: RnfH family protein [unclassified Acinetobacter]